MNSRAFAALIGATLLAACGKDAAQRIDAPVPGASIKFYNFALNAPGVNFYANDTMKVTAIASASGSEDTVGTKYSFVGNGGLYSGVVPAQYTFAAKIATPTDKGLAIGSAQSTLSDGKYYSFYLSGFYDATAKKSDAFVVEDPFPTTIDFGVTYVRFVNAISNAQPLQLFAKSSVTGVEVAIGDVLPYKSAGVFVSLAPAAYDLSARYAGVTTNAISKTGVSFVGGKVYTVTARGDITVTSASALNRPFLDNTANR
jgi:hypothetical protein